MKKGVGSRSESSPRRASLILVVVATLVAARSGVLARDTTGPSVCREGARQREVNVFLRIRADHEGRDIADLTADTDVTLADENACVVDRLGKSLLEDLRLKTALHQLRTCQPENKVELALRVEEKVFKQGLAKSIHHARVLIRQRHIRVGRP